MVICLACVPSYGEAAVTISEIAWMGDASSANSEWIELYNDAAPVTVDGWVLTDGNNLSIELTGELGSGYAVLARNRSDGQYVVTPFLVYTGALVNTGATLTLTRADGSIEDQVAGGEDWGSIGGDNTTKETAQLTTSGWRTGVPTPGRVNVANGTVPGSSTSPTAGVGTSKSAGSSGIKVTSRPAETVRLEIPDSVLVLAPDMQTTAYVNQPLSFGVTATGIGDTWIDSLTYRWNFGDLATGSSKKPIHTYRYPGTYVATVEATFKRHSQILKIPITILPATMALARGDAGELFIHNNAPYEVDVSGYRLVSNTTHVFPPRSIMAAKSTLTLPPGTGGGYYSRVDLRDTGGQVVATWPPDLVSVTKTATNDDGMVPPTAPTPLVSSVPVAPTATTNRMATSGMPAYVGGAVLPLLPEVPASPAPHHELWTYGALGALLLAIIGSLLATRPKMISTHDESVTSS